MDDILHLPKDKTGPTTLNDHRHKGERDQRVRIAVAMGDGIGPEIMKATLRVMEAAGARIEPEMIEVGEKVYLSGNTAGITSKAWEVIRNNKIILKAPITTPRGKGYKSLNVTMRKTLGLFANVRPVMALHPYVSTHFKDMDVVIIRENEEDLYAGIEHQQTADVVQCLKLITRPGCERIIRYAFEFAKAHDRRKVTCMVKDNIMKLTDGLFHRVFDEVAAEYPDIEHETQIIDIGSARLAARPEDYDVIVTSNLYGDIISDIAAEIAGSVGMAGSANVGMEVSMFEAIHGSAPDIAGQGIANPSGLLNAAVMMLAHIGQTQVADRIRNAWLRTLEDGIHTPDIFQMGKSKKRADTQQFADAIIERLGQLPLQLPASSMAGQHHHIRIPAYERQSVIKELLGVDVFLDWSGSDANELGDALLQVGHDVLNLKMITNRGVKVFPNGMSETFCTDHWRCRFVKSENYTEAAPVSYREVLSLLKLLDTQGFDVIKTENLYQFDKVRAFSLGQGE